MYKSQIFKAFLWSATLQMLFSACGSGETSQQATDINGQGTETENFASFYAKFHTDSLFQIDRISWPLNGNFVQDSAGVATDLHHKKVDWLMHRPIDDNPDFVQQIQPLTEDLDIEEIKALAGKYKIERRFSRMGDGWHLIYYREAGL